MALLRYADADTTNVFTGPTDYRTFINRPGLQLNSLNRGQGFPGLMSVADLRNARETAGLRAEPDRQIFVSFRFRTFTLNKEYCQNVH